MSMMLGNTVVSTMLDNTVVSTMLDNTAVSTMLDNTVVSPMLDRSVVITYDVGQVCSVHVFTMLDKAVVSRCWTTL